MSRYGSEGERLRRLIMLGVLREGQGSAADVLGEVPLQTPIRPREVPVENREDRLRVIATA